MLLGISCNQSKELFQENSKDWEVYGDANWHFSGNELIGEVTNGEGYALTRQTYKDFLLELEFKPDNTINSGVYIRCKNENINAMDCYEINIWDLNPDQDNRTGGIVMRTAPLAYVETIDKWNTYKIKAEKGQLQIWINDILANETKDGSLSEGHIGLQAKGTGEIRFRNLKITPLAMD